MKMTAEWLEYLQTKNGLTPRGKRIRKCVCLCTIYDGRCTIWGVPALAREFCRADAKRNFEKCAGVIRKRRWQTGAAYVRFTKVLEWPLSLLPQLRLFYLSPAYFNTPN